VTYCFEDDLICDGLPIVLPAHLSYALDAVPAATMVADLVQVRTVRKHRRILFKKNVYHIIATRLLVNRRNSDAWKQHKLLFFTWRSLRWSIFSIPTLAYQLPHSCLRRAKSYHTSIGRQLCLTCRFLSILCMNRSSSAPSFGAV
jgi:hypothetical protein